MQAALRASRVLPLRSVVSPVAASNGSMMMTRRWLNIHEHYGFSMLSSYGIQTPRGKVAYSAKEAEQVALEFPSQDLVIKAQVLAGGRGKGHFENGLKGGVRLINSAVEAKMYAESMIGHKLITKQTGAAGRICNAVFLVEQLKIKKEYYVAILMDRTTQGPVIVASAQGGMDIEAVAAENPDAIIKLPVDIKEGLQENDVKLLAHRLGFTEAAVPQVVDNIMKLYKAFLEKDATMIEINPFSELTDGRVVCMDAKVNFDDNADFRQKEVFSWRDVSQEDEREVKAHEFNLNYIGLDGSIGCLVNGAGLAMATMDIIKLYGGFPANFLDVGGGANAKQVAEAFKIISTDPHVSAILVNIFGGIMRCDIIAQGIISAVSQLNLQIPLVVRLQGTKVEEAKKLIAESGLRIISCDDLDEAADKVVQLSNIVQLAKKINLQVSFELPI